MANEVVYWSTKGRALHRHQNCPAFVRARVRVMEQMKRGAYDNVGDIRSYDFAADGGGHGQQHYPPEEMLPCRICMP
jgi:hypothetical protein